MEHIFGEMYQVPEKIRLPYLKIKILELLLYLDAVSIPEKETERPYFYRTQVEKVKAVRQFLMDHMEENFTQEELSRRFDFPLTPMKNCFSAAYGSSIGAWLTTYRMNQAAELLLKDRERTISEIGCQVATIRNADQILVVEDGRIAEKGTHDELIRENGLYRRFTEIREKAEGWRIAAE